MQPPTHHSHPVPSLRAKTNSSNLESNLNHALAEHKSSPSNASVISVQRAVVLDLKKHLTQNLKNKPHALDAKHLDITNPFVRVDIRQNELTIEWYKNGQTLLTKLNTLQFNDQKDNTGALFSFAITQMNELLKGVYGDEQLRVIFKDVLEKVKPVLEWGKPKAIVAPVPS